MGRGKPATRPQVRIEIPNEGQGAPWYSRGWGSGYDGEEDRLWIIVLVHVVWLPPQMRVPKMGAGVIFSGVFVPASVMVGTSV